MLEGRPGHDPPEAEAQQLAGWKGDLAFDVGANCGQSIRKILTQYSRVIALEPAIESYEVLAADYPGTYRIVTLNAAVSDTDGDVTLLAIPQEMEMGQLVTWVGYEHDNAPVRTVPSITVDTLASTFGVPDLVKVDTEGHEVHVLRGAPETLRKGQTNWMIEFHSKEFYDECCSILRKARYIVEPVRHPHYEYGSFSWFNHGWLRAVHYSHFGGV